MHKETRTEKPCKEPRFVDRSLKFLSAKFLVLALAVVFLSGCVSGPIDPSDKSTWRLLEDIGLPLEEKEWTFIMYFNGDNNLEGDLYEFLDQVSKAGSDENINIVVQTDTITSYLPLGSTAKRLYIVGDSYKTVYDIGEQNMGDPNTLSNFINWSAENFPAKKYALILWNHGSDSFSTSLDDTDQDILDLPELVSALDGSKQKVGEFEIIGFDMCLFGSVDVDYAISPYGKIRVGSPDVTYNNWDYESVFRFLKENPQAEGREVASKIVNTFLDMGKTFDIGSFDDSLIISAVDLKKIPYVKEEFAGLVTLLSADIENKWVDMAKAKFSSSKYSLGSPGGGLTDLHSFLESLMLFTNDTAVIEASNKIIKEVKEAVIETSAGRNHKKSLGISFKFADKSLNKTFFEIYEEIAAFAREHGLQGSPETFVPEDLNKTLFEAYVESSAFARESGFSSLMEKYIQQQVSYISNITVYTLPDEYVVSEANPIISIPADFYGENIVHRYMWVAKDMGDYYDMLFASDLIDSGSSEYGVKTYRSGYNFEDVKWDGMVRGANNGKEEAIVFSQPFDVVNDLFFSSGTYSKDSESFDSKIIYNVAEGGKMVEVRAYDSLEGQYLPFLPHVQPGDEFTFNGLKFWKETWNLEPYTGTTMVFGEDGLRRTMMKAPNGKYTIFLVVEDIVGERIYGSVEVVVDL